MKTKYKYIEFCGDKNVIMDEGMWRCKNKKSGKTLCYIVYYSDWNQYVADGLNENAVFSAGCLNDIIDFLQQLNEEK